VLDQTVADLQSEGIELSMRAVGLVTATAAHSELDRLQGEGG
jgi:hypothetical protein